MNRDNIDFTKTGVCCLCGAERTEGFSRAVIRRFGEYTSCRVQICPTCLKLFPAARQDAGGEWDIESVDGVPAEMAKSAAQFAAKAKKALAAAWAEREDLARWVAEPFEIAGGRTFGQVAMKAWTDAKDKAFAVKLAVIDHFKSKRPEQMACPVRGKPLVVEAPDAEKLEINDVLKFRCPDGCLEFDETELASLYSDAHADYVRRLGSRRMGWQDGIDQFRWEQKMQSVTALSCTAYALDVVEKTLSDLAYERYDAVRDAMYDAQCRGCKRGDSADTCGECRKKFEAAHPEINKRFTEHIYDFKKGMRLRDLFAALKRSDEYKASEHCKLWCETSPDTAAHGVCGATGGYCGKCDGEKSCRKCGMHVEGKPLGNFLATAGMCQHYQNGKCLAHCGKDGKWKGRKDLDVCTFAAGHYVFSDHNFCESFKLREGLDLDAALAASRAGKSYSGYYR